MNTEHKIKAFSQLEETFTIMRDMEIVLIYHAFYKDHDRPMTVFEKLAVEESDLDLANGSDVIGVIYRSFRRFIYNPLVRRQLFERMAERISAGKNLPEFIRYTKIEKTDVQTIADAIEDLSDRQEFRKLASQTEIYDDGSMEIPSYYADMVRLVFTACGLKVPVSRNNVLALNTEIPVLLDMSARDRYRDLLFERLATLEFLHFFWARTHEDLSIERMPANIMLQPAHMYRYILLVNTIITYITPELMPAWSSVYITRSFLEAINDPVRVIEHPNIMLQRKKKGRKLRARLREMIEDTLEDYLEDKDMACESLLTPRYNGIPVPSCELTDEDKTALATIIEDNIIHACAYGESIVFPVEDLFEERMTVPINHDPDKSDKPCPEPYGATILVSALVPAYVGLFRAYKAAGKESGAPLRNFNADRSIAGVKEARIAEKDKKIEELSGIISAKDGEIQRLKGEISRYMARNNELADRLNNLPSPGENAAVGALEAENRALRERIAFLEKLMEKKPAADICAEGEEGDIIIDILSKWHKSNGNSCRRRDIVGEFLKNNPASGNLQLRQERIRSLLKDYKGLTDRFKAEMKDLGFNIELAGKHAKVYYGEDRERYVLISLTPSDPRSGKNTATSLIQLFT